MQYILVTPPECLPMLRFAADREYLAKPIPVEPISCDVHTRLVRVHDPARGVSFPVEPRNLRRADRLTRLQRDAAHAPR